MDATSTAPDVYAQLPDLRDDKIRLLILRSGQLDEPVHCLLFTCSINDPPVYEALSYAWGTRSLVQSITVNDAPILVFDNLGQALRQLRDPELDRVLWVDAICINQANLEERSLQVPKMQQVFRNAKEVIIWVGAEADESDRAIDDIFALHVDQHIAQIPFYKEFTADALRTAEGRIVDRAYPLRCFFERAWFKRMWTLQEIVLAKNASFYCGNRTFSWTCLEEVNNAYLKHALGCCNNDWKEQNLDATYLWYPITEFVTVVSRLRRARSRHALLDLLLLCRSRLANDHRDKIYGILGLNDSHDVKQIKPNYILSPRQVYTQVARTLVQGSVGLDLLAHVFSSCQIIDLPSWVPDWSQADYNNPNSFFSASNYLNQYKACGSVQSQFEVNEDILSVRAIFIDTVVECGPMMRGSDGKGKLRPKVRLSSEPYDILSDFLTWESIAGLEHTDVSPYFSGPSNICDAFWRTMIMDVWHDYRDGQHRRSLPSDFKAYLKWRAWFEERTQPGGDPDGSVYATGVQDSDIYTFDMDILTQHSVRRFFRTKSGHIGMGPMEMEHGDYVVIIAGARQPFMLRPSSSGSTDCTSEYSFESSSLEKQNPILANQAVNTIDTSTSEESSTFTLVGFSYLHGFMDGEGIVDSEWRKIYIQ